VKICDPAIGSGAFPMGLLQEIFTAKQTLWHFEHGSLKDFPASDVKLNIIQNSIYGVDIEKGAVDIARLRFWLSLVVDEEEPKALPNLDYKIVVGNSLISKLGNDIIDIDWNLNETSHGLFGADLAKQKGELLKIISAEQKEFFNPDSNKKKLTADIRKLKIDLLINQLELMVTTKGIETKPNSTGKKLAEQTDLYLQTLGWKDSIKQLKKLKDQPDKPLDFFDWKLDFPEVLNELINPNAGFDIVIGNPPYVSNKDLKDKTNLESKYKTAKGQYDLFSLFIELSFILCKEKGIHSFIIPDSYVGRSNFTNSRAEFFSKSNCKKLLHINNVFESANVSSLIYLTQKCLKPHNSYISYVKAVSVSDWKNSSFSQISFFQDLILNTNNHRILHLDSVSYRLLQKLLKSTINIESCCFLWRGEEIGKKSDLIIETNIKNSLPILSGSNVQKYAIKQPVKYIKRSNVSKPISDYSKEKVVVRQLGEVINSTFDKDQCITTQSVYNIVSDLFPIKVLTGILNSSLINFIYQNYFKEKQEFPRILLENIKELPLPVKNRRIFSEVSKLVDKIISQKSQGNETTTIEQQIDSLVYKLYDLTYDEVKVIDPNVPFRKKEYESIELE
ncbi:MAG: Eco57I restriction-modification methylase domain-containing protein, partial [Flavobacteriaceae bacterium]|nr:Eco57I restriction-modification methylase domain-containing protein [Flavobacteriaceae bacterium]